jgi:hypothetical protein
VPTLRPPVGGNERFPSRRWIRKSRAEVSGAPPSHPQHGQHIMAFVRVEQRNGRLAAAVRIDTVKGRDGPLTKGTVTVISNIRRGSGDAREDEATSI